MLRFPRAMLRNHTAVPSAIRVPILRTGSPTPFFGSTMITSAPWSAMVMVKCGPGRNCERSRTRMPESFIQLNA